MNRSFIPLANSQWQIAKGKKSDVFSKGKEGGFDGFSKG
jgi:hypothetical protein